MSNYTWTTLYIAIAIATKFMRQEVKFDHWNMCADNCLPV